MRKPLIAGILSLKYPGLGQLYNGRLLAALLWFIFGVVFWPATGGLLGWIPHLVSAVCAYSYAKEHPVRF
jgi:TM2 domain-containing membrane protein YozV